MARRENAIPRGLSHATPLYIAKAEGAVIEDVDGNCFLDFAGGIGCLNVGHRPPTILGAVEDQLKRHLHLCFMVTPYESYVRLAEKLNSLAPGSFPKKTLILTTGAEAVENAVKIARAYTKRPAIICFEDAFHGRTLLTMSLTSKTDPYKAGFGPFASEVYRIPYAYLYRGGNSATAESVAHHLEDAFKRVVAPESVAAVIAEPVLGEGGFVVPPRDYFRAIHKICRKHGILLMADEVQSGIARTGKWFASEHFGIEPDLITTAKSLGGCAPGSKNPRASFHLSKNCVISTARSFTTAKLRSGSRRSRSPSPATSLTRVRQVQRGRPFTTMAQEPHMPTRQAKR